MKKISKRQYILGFGVSVLLLSLVRCFAPDVAKSPIQTKNNIDSLSSDSVAYALSDSLSNIPNDVKNKESLADSIHSSVFYNSDGSLAQHRIFSVPHFGNTFPDQNDVQLIAAQKWGVKPIADRQDAMNKKSGLVYVGSNPYFYIDKLHSSIPYLVPRASVLLQDIGKAYYDSLMIKGIPLHKIIVTSVLRSKADVAKLRTHNGNATQNSCHMYGTTFDLCYNRYVTVEAPGEKRRRVTNDTLKWVLSEVLRDMRENKRCLIKYEVNQGCFHITVN